jgi:hypothetical protein
MTRMNRFPAALAAATLLAACSDAPTGAAPESGPTLAQQVAALGFRADMIEDHGEYVVVEGDIRLSRTQLRAGADPMSADPLAPRFQYRTHALVGSPAVNQIVVDLSGLASEPGWAAAARDAMAAWNAVPSSYVRMVEGSPGNISVGTNCGLGSNVAAQASWPSGGNPGPTIAVNPCFGWTIGHAQRVHNMVHEFGHTLGLRHTNWQALGEPTGTQGAVHVPGTPTGNDNGSVMNGGTALNSWAGFSGADLLATRTLYPLPLPAPWVASGNPVVQWGALGATEYMVQLVRWKEVRNQNYEVISSTYEIFAVGTTAQNSIWDADRTYTGATTCQSGSTSYYFQYDVQAVFPTGSTWGSVPAPVANCSQVGDDT